MKSLESFKIPKLDDLTTQVEQIMADDFRRGEMEVKAELDRQREGKTINPLVSQRASGVPVFEMSEPRKNNRVIRTITGREFAAVDPALYGIPQEVWAYLENSSRMLIASEAAKLKRKALMAANQMMLSGNYDMEVLKATINEGVREGLPLQANLYGNIGFSHGRDAESKRHEHEVREATYSAIMDGRLCENCAPNDGATFKSYAEAMRMTPAPNPNCLGTVLQCRCMIVLTLAREERAAA